MMAKGKLAPEAKVSIFQGLGVPISQVLAWFLHCLHTQISFLPSGERETRA